MPARSFILDIDLGEDDIPDDASKDEMETIHEQRVEKKIEKNLDEDMSYRIVDISLNFEPEPRYSRSSVPVIIFGTPRQLSRYSVSRIR